MGDRAGVVWGVKRRNKASNIPVLPVLFAPAIKLICFRGEMERLLKPRKLLIVKVVIIWSRCIYVKGFANFAELIKP